MITMSITIALFRAHMFMLLFTIIDLAPSTEYLLMPELYPALTLSYRNYALGSNDLVTDLSTSLRYLVTLI